MATTAPTALALAEILGPSSRVTRRVEIYESDATTMWMASPKLIDGSISVSQSRQERRTCEFTFHNEDSALDNYPGGFWYDKVIKAYRGVETDVGSWETQIGEFLIDDIGSPHFPFQTSVSGRDYTKRLLTSKFPVATTFAADVNGNHVPTAPETIIRTIALNGGITKFIMPVTGRLTGAPWTFEGGDERWKAINDIAGAFGYELFFDATGYLVMQEYADPLTTPEVWTFETGVMGNLVSIKKSASDTRIYNVIVVKGEATDVPPVWAKATNTNPDSPTRIAKLGERVYTYVNPRVTTTQQCLDIANKFLKIHALEQFEISLESIVIPWLEAGTVVRFTDPNPNPGEPDRYLLSDFTIPMRLGPMQATGKRVTIVG